MDGPKDQFDPWEQAQLIDPTTVAGRLTFFCRLAGGDDPKHNYDVWVSLELVRFLTDPANFDFRHKNRVRGPRTKAVGCYSEIMQRGEWIQGGGVPLLYTDDGRLANGFTRMRAIDNSGCPQWLEIRGPVTFDYVISIDQGDIRSDGDMITLTTDLPVELLPNKFWKVAWLIRYHLTGSQTAFPDKSRERNMLVEQFMESYKVIFGLISDKRVRYFRKDACVAAFTYAHAAVRGTPQEAALLEVWDNFVHRHRDFYQHHGHPFVPMYERIVELQTAAQPQQLMAMRALLRGISAVLNGRTARRLTTRIVPQFEDPIFKTKYMTALRFP